MQHKEALCDLWRFGISLGDVGSQSRPYFIELNLYLKIKASYCLLYFLLNPLTHRKCTVTMGTCQQYSPTTNRYCDPIEGNFYKLVCQVVSFIIFNS